jgi:hypothetical protein
MNLIPAPWETDPKSKVAVLEAWNGNREFHTADIMFGYGRTTTKRELEAIGEAHGITIRYAKQTKVVYIP